MLTLVCRFSKVCRFLKILSILACYALYLIQESRKIPTCFRLASLDS